MNQQFFGSRVHGAPPLSFPPSEFVMPVFPFGPGPPPVFGQPNPPPMPSSVPTPFIPSDKRTIVDERNKTFYDKVRAQLGLKAEEPDKDAPSYSKSTVENAEGSMRHYLPVTESKFRNEIQDQWKLRIANEAINGNLQKVEQFTAVREDLVDFVVEFAEKLRKSIYAECQQEFEEQMAFYTSNAPGGSVAEDPFNSHTESLDVPVDSYQNSTSNNLPDTQSDFSDVRVSSPVFDPIPPASIIRRDYSSQSTNKLSTNSNDVQGQTSRQPRNYEDELKLDDQMINTAFDQINEMMHNMQSRSHSVLDSPVQSISSSFKEENMQRFGRESPRQRQQPEQANQPEEEQLDKKLAAAYFSNFDFCMKTTW